MSEISERISKIRGKFCSGSNRIFAEKLEKGEKYTSMLCSGSSNPGSKMLDHILETFPYVSRVWLLTGEGEMLKADNLGRDTASETALPYNPAHPTPSSASSEELLNKIIQSKDDEIAELKSRIEEQTRWIATITERYLHALDDIKRLSEDTNAIVKDTNAKIGFKLNNQ